MKRLKERVGRLEQQVAPPATPLTDAELVWRVSVLRARGDDPERLAKIDALLQRAHERRLKHDNEATKAG
jgi:hypothetical protein